MARQLVCEMRQSVDVQGVRLAATAAALEADLRALDTTSALGDADDDDAPAGSSAAGGGAEDIVALSGAFVAPAELRTEGEARLVAHLEEMLKAERAAQRDELRALQTDHPEVLCAPPRLPEKADPGKAALLRAEIYYDAAGRPPRLSTLGESEYEELTSPGSPTRAHTTTRARAAAAKEAMADGAKKIYVQRVVVPPSPRAAADGADDDGDGEADLGGDAIAYARAAAAAAAGWDARSDERLRQLESQLRDRPHATLLEQLSIELPHMGRDACERRLDWLARRAAVCGGAARAGGGVGGARGRARDRGARGDPGPGGEGGAGGGGEGRARGAARQGRAAAWGGGRHPGRARAAAPRRRRRRASASGSRGWWRRRRGGGTRPSARTSAR